MSSLIEKINWFEESEPRTCLWCARSGIILNAADNIDAVVCMDMNTRKTTKKDAPSNREYRTYLKVMDSMEQCDRWTPTKIGSNRMKLMDALGLIGGTE